MRLWHIDLLPDLPRQQILGQHREVCALRGKGWGKKHSTVDYVFQYSYWKLFFYHLKVMQEMEHRGYNPDPIWKNAYWRGNAIGQDLSEFTKPPVVMETRYPEHNEVYKAECVANLIGKGIYLHP
jgi:uncharacterized protein (TIGR02328 family)